MVTDRFPACLAFTERLNNDGQAFHKTAGDRGGATAWGVTLGEFQHHQVAAGFPCPTEDDLRKATKEQLAGITRADYWNTTRAADLRPGADLCVFDFGFGSGPPTSVLVLQRALNAMGGKLVEDKKIGPATISTANGMPQSVLITRLGAAHEAFYRRIVAGDASQAKFINGWVRRNNDRVKLALQMDAGTA